MLGRNHGFPSKLLCLTVPKFREVTILFFRMLGVSKNFMPKKGNSQLSVENLLSHSTEKHQGRTFLCFKKILVLEIFLDKGGGRVSGLSVKIFLSHHSPQIFVLEPFSVSLVSSMEKLYA